MTCSVVAGCTNGARLRATSMPNHWCDYCNPEAACCSKGTFTVSWRIVTVLNGPVHVSEPIGCPQGKGEWYEYSQWTKAQGP
eukprot:scaffold67591_cov97-Phaeocystis_antarctica.AAC.1